MPSLQVSLVINRPDEDDLMRCLHALTAAIDFARDEGVVHSVNVALIDNSRDEQSLHRLIELANLFFRPPVEFQFLHGHADVGLGGAYNLSLHGSGADYHLLLRVYAEIHREALAEAISWMQANDEVGLATAALQSPSGAPVYSCFSYPTVFDTLTLFLAPNFVRRAYLKRLNAFRMTDKTNLGETFSEMSCLSGDCLVARRAVTDQSGGFDPRFLQYFGAFDLSLRLGMIAKLAYLPNVRVTVYPSDDGFIECRPKRRWRFFKDAVAFFRKNDCRFF
jgi:GT2 family glycosyltransferase